MKQLLIKAIALRKCAAKLYDLAKPGSRKEYTAKCIYYALHSIVEKLEGYLMGELETQSN